jgi:translation initiation factor 4A
MEFTQTQQSTKNSYVAGDIESWEDDKIDLKGNLLRGIYSFGFEIPSPIQKKAINPFINRFNDKGKRIDIIAQAQSGTGKTGAFTVSSLQIVDEEIKNTQVIILEPTHELAKQTYKVIGKDGLSHYMDIHCKLLIGGTSIEEDKKSLEETPPQIIVGTPGRIQDMLQRDYIKTEHLRLLILDEADEMLSSGFKEQVYRIFQFMPDDIQMGLFSATMPEELHELSSKFLDNNASQILVKKEMLTLQGIAQFYINVQNDTQKYETLKDLYETLSMSQSIIYCNSTKRVDDLHEAMMNDEFPVEKIHGKMTSEERTSIDKRFKAGHARVLICSDLFARGIDVQQVQMVINFDIPRSKETYLHRIGRSGRWGRKGIAINFQTKHDCTYLKQFEEYYNTEIRQMPQNYASHLE